MSTGAAHLGAAQRRSLLEIATQLVGRLGTSDPLGASSSIEAALLGREESVKGAERRSGPLTGGGRAEDWCLGEDACSVREAAEVRP